ncbi:hypothetical protein NDU88_001023 [Pleurodeles waltl]|uniref:Uncharacterized protein n=1 Tax=Pleurodeles waltl TaxID=8319 RepID=A0AAV7R7T8_PLEWA|nr:hypothetical protein NDU88_001023 [Pleurodeles waltl]
MPLFENRRLCLCRNSLLLSATESLGTPEVCRRFFSAPDPARPQARHQLRRLRDPKWAGQEASQLHGNHVALVRR